MELFRSTGAGAAEAVSNNAVNTICGDYECIPVTVFSEGGSTADNVVGAAGEGASGRTHHPGDLGGGVVPAAQWRLHSRPNDRVVQVDIATEIRIKKIQHGNYDMHQFLSKKGNEVEVIYLPNKELSAEPRYIRPPTMDGAVSAAGRLWVTTTEVG